MSNIIGLDRKTFLMDEEIRSPTYESDFLNMNKNLNEVIPNSRGYSINDKIEEVESSKISAIGLFSGAGGLDIGTQLAGAKIISSLDLDKDSVATIRANNFWLKFQTTIC